jgi:undecaprenyl-diphosphatase
MEQNKKYGLLMFLILIITSVFRILVSINLGLGDDEAHYWQYSQNISLSYYDHPSMIAYLIRLSTYVFGNTVLGVRMVAISCFFFTCFFLFLLIEKMYNTKTAFYTILLIQIIPVFFIGSIISIPDVALSALWMAYLYVFYMIIIEKEPLYWYLLGCLLGLALLSKYTAVFIPISTIIFLILSSQNRYILFEKNLYFSFLIALLIFTPIIIWNWEYDFVSFGYQISRSIINKNETITFKPIIFLANIIAQSLYVSPPIFIIIIYFTIKTLIEAFKYKNIDNNILFLFSFSIPVIIAFNFVGLFKEILPHWPIIGFIPLIVLTVHEYMSIKHTKFVIITKYFTLLFTLGLTLIVLLQSLYKIIPMPKNMPEKYDVTNELYGWDIVGKKLDNIIKNKDYFILTNIHYIASQIAFYTPSHPKVYCLNINLDQYDFWQNNISDLNHKSAIFVSDNRFNVKPSEIYPFAKITELEPVNIYRKNKIVRTFYLYLCENFILDKINYEMIKPVNRRNVFINIRYYDNKIVHSINNLTKRHKIFDYIMIGFTSLGNGFYLAPIMVIVLYLINKKNFLKNLFVFFLIVMIGGIFIQVLKSLYNQPRPLKEYADIKTLLSPLKERGFPSGHTYTIFVAVVFVCEKIKKILYNYKWYCFILYFIAIMVGISRIYVGAHFMTDVIAGALIGIFFTYSCLAVIKLIESYKKNFI